MTYAQGASAAIVTMGTIFAADTWGLPVSTTHILSSGVAGTMAANGSGLRWMTVRNIAAGWVLTLPAAAVLSGLLYCFPHVLLSPGADGSGRSGGTSMRRPVGILLGVFALDGRSRGASGFDPQAQAADREGIATVTVDFGTKKQIIRGFGGSTGWLGPLTTQQATALFNQTNGLGLSIVRVRIDPRASASNHWVTSQWTDELTNARRRSPRIPVRS